jgi:hypothetical protein
MERKISTTEIDRFFNQLKEQPAIYNEEKVHQIINSPAAKARLKGKTNLLKFTIMTTFFAVIISAVLWWTGGESSTKYQDTRQRTQDKGQEIVSGSKYQVSRPLGNDANSPETKSANSSSYTGTKNEETNTDNKLIAMANLNENSNGLASNQTNESVGNPEKSAQPAQPNEQRSNWFVPDTIQPTDGSRFILQLTNEELKKIGFQFTDSSIVFESLYKGKVYKYGSFKRKLKGTWKFDGDNVVIASDTGFHFEYYSSSPDDKMKDNAAPKNHFDYYPVGTSTQYFTEYRPVLSDSCSLLPGFDMLNDTLLPIIFPSLDDVGEKKIIWFVLSDNLYNLLKEKHATLLDEFNTYKKSKKLHRYKDLLVYRSPFLFDESRVVKPTRDELQKMGFTFYADSTVYKGRNSRCQYKVMLSERRTNTQTIKYDYEPQIPELNDGCLALFITDYLGNPLYNSLGLLPILFPNEGEIYTQIPLLVPVEVNVVGFYKSLYFWFLPNENFFKAISKEVSSEIKAEYNYITAEDKSTLEKPECKYFDECKNTLKVSSFKVYPNPANTNATVSFTLPEAIDGRITLVDLAGRERQVLQPQTSFAKGQHSIQVDLSNVPEGIYLLTLYSNKGVQTQRMIVAR